MKSRRRILIDTLVLMSFAWGCSEKVTEPVAHHTNAFPLTAGNRWHYYQIDRFTFSNYPNYAQVDTTDIVRRVIPPDSVALALGCAAMDDSMISLSGHVGNQVRRQWISLRNSRLEQYGRQMRLPDHTDPPSIGTPEILLDLPLAAGKSWNTYDVYTPSTRLTVTGSGPMHAAGRTFNCDIISTDASSYPDPGGLYTPTYWYSNEGMIAEVFIDTSFMPDQQGNIDTVVYVRSTVLLDYDIR